VTFSVDAASVLTAEAVERVTVAVGHTVIITHCPVYFLSDFV
jgi:hypothetical protein